MPCIEDSTFPRVVIFKTSVSIVDPKIIFVGVTEAFSASEGYGRVKYKQASKDQCIPVDWDKCVLKWTRNLCGGMVMYQSRSSSSVSIYQPVPVPVQSTVEFNQALNTS
jgi:hypothetical protein